MTDTRCGYQGDRGDALIAYLYDDFAGSDRQAFEAHLTRCAQCRAELAALRGVRMNLTKWAPPEPAVGGRPSTTGQQPSAARTLWRDIPAWAQVAAAVLVLGVSAGAANLTIHYDRDGLTVGTGWLRPAAPADVRGSGSARSAVNAAAAPAADVAPKPRTDDLSAAPWRAELASLERQLRSELHSIRPASVRVGAANEEEIIRRVTALVEASEHKQNRELALRVAQALQDVDMQRRADLARIDRAFGPILSRTGAELLKQRADINYLTVRTSQR
jgi:hypothetical protein